jgi:hypothetical protein
MTFIWIIFGISWFYLIGLGGIDVMGFILQCYLAVHSVEGWIKGERHLYWENYTGENVVLILLTHLVAWGGTELIAFLSGYPVFGPLVELGVILLLDTYLTNLDGYV